MVELKHRNSKSQIIIVTNLENKSNEISGLRNKK